MEGALLALGGAASNPAKIDDSMLVVAGAGDCAGRDGVSNESKMEEFIDPEGAGSCEGCVLFCWGAASKVSKIDDSIRLEGCALICWGAASKPAKIEDSIWPLAGGKSFEGCVVCCWGAASKLSKIDDSIWPLAGATSFEGGDFCCVGAASKLSKIDDFICAVAAFGAGGVGLGGASNESNIEDWIESFFKFEDWVAGGS